MFLSQTHAMLNYGCLSQNRTFLLNCEVAIGRAIVTFSSRYFFMHELELGTLNTLHWDGGTAVQILHKTCKYEVLLGNA